MNDFFSVLKMGCIAVVSLVALFLILLALPKSRLRSLVLEIGGWATSTVSAVYVVNPFDIPFVFDDIAVGIVGLASAVFAYFARKERLAIDTGGDASSAK